MSVRVAFFFSSHALRLVLFLSLSCRCTVCFIAKELCIFSILQCSPRGLSLIAFLFHVVVFVSSLRLDLGYQTVVLDTAILPVSAELAPKIGEVRQALTGIGFLSVTVDNDELKLRKQIMPAWMERCRQWKHRPT
jgi:hypothetical protein